MGIIGAAEAQSQTLFCCQISSTRVIARTTTSFSSLSLAPPLSSLLWPARPWTLASTAPRKIPAIKIPPNNLQTSTRRRVHWCLVANKSYHRTLGPSAIGPVLGQNRCVCALIWLGLGLFALMCNGPNRGFERCRDLSSQVSP